MRHTVFQTVVETTEFIRQTENCMDDKTRQDFINYIAINPLVGDLITGTGGARKVRWLTDNNKGKRGGARIIYYYYDETVPIFLFTAYKKNEKDDLTAKEKYLLKSIIKQLINQYYGEENE